MADDDTCSEAPSNPDAPDDSLVYCLFGGFEKATLRAAQQHM